MVSKKRVASPNIDDFAVLGRSRFLIDSNDVLGMDKKSGGPWSAAFLNVPYGDASQFWIF
ncbi:hypothetical protein C4F50_15655 [Flavobacterium sp. KB82]|uniref:Uncharacterized protein n=1 Tax=Flavobacterium hungaricum TaxID=2082725 RepID=A0ABR9TM89_9FLAO|nr:hypothetical protein [Flavobacterium hungaricum]